MFISVDPPVMSDHSFISATATFTDDSVTREPAYVRRNWSSFDIDKFRSDLMNSELVINLPDNCDDFFATYDHSQIAVRRFSAVDSVRW